MGGFEPPDDCSTQSPGTKDSGVAQWAERGTRNAVTGVRFSAPDPVYSGVAQWAERGTCNAVTGVRFSAPDPVYSGVAQVAAHTLGKGEDVVSITTARSKRAWYRGRALGFQPRDEDSSSSVRSKFRGIRPAARTAACQVAHAGSSPAYRSKFGGLVITAARMACNHSVGIRLPGPPPDVAVAEWFRRLAVNQSTRVRFSPVTPSMRA
jgi:hypothetical protein